MRKVIFIDGPPGSIRLSPCPIRRCGRTKSVCPSCQQSINRCVSRRSREQRERLTGQGELEL